MASLGSGDASSAGSLAQILIVLALSLGLAAKAAAHGGDATKIHACVKGNGEIRIIGPNDTCGSNWSPLDWSAAGSQITSQPLNLSVDCAAPGQTVASALAQASTTTGRVTITLTGVCAESVTLSRDAITLQGAQAGDGLTAPSPGSTVLTVIGQRINLNQLTITGGSQGIAAQRGAAFSGSNVRVSGFTGSGVALMQGATASLSNPTIENGGGGTGVSLSTNGSLSMMGGVIQNNFIGINAGTGGSATLANATIRGHSFIGGLATSGGSILLLDSVTENNGGQGLHAFMGGTVWMAGSNAESRNNNGTGVIAQGGAAIVTRGARVAGNNAGVAVDNGGSLMLQSGAIVENNIGFGVYATGGGSVAIQEQVIVRGNTGDGVRLRDTTILRFMWPGGSEIVNNGGAGIACDPAPAAPLVAGSADIGTVTGGINCPVTF